MRWARLQVSAAAAAFALLAVPAMAEPDAPALYAEHCAECHGADRLGRIDIHRIHSMQHAMWMNARK